MNKQDQPDNKPSTAVEEPTSIYTSTALDESEPGPEADTLDFYIAVGVLKKQKEPIEQDTDEYPASAIANLEKHNWIRIYTIPCPSGSHPQWGYVRVYVLPDDIGRKSIPRSSAPLRRALKTVLAKVDRSPEAWKGIPAGPDGITITDGPSGRDGGDGPAEDESLWYIFNTLQDPDPHVENMRDLYARQAMEELLSVVPGGDISGQDYLAVAGLKTALYPYQRRSAAMMVQREAQPARMLDPRLQAYRNPLGQEYFYDKEEGSIVREKKMYSEACGGILAETMGCGKTLICLAVILATQGHFPRIPLEHQEIGTTVREKTGSLVEMAAASAGRLSLPWKRHFDWLKSDGLHYGKCVQACEENRGSYIIHPPPARYTGRNGVAYPRPPPQHLLLCSGTLVIAPPNLVDHWEGEITKHTEGLKVLVLRNSSDETPSADDLLQYDIVLFSRIRLEKEAGEVVDNRRFLTRPDDSPLTKVHWLRIIVDEGHNVVGHGQRTNMLHLLDRLHVERRWIVSGTPSSGLYGVEVSLASRETYSSDTDLSNATNTALRGRKKTGSAANSELKDLDKLRHIVVDFLDLKPWSNSRADDPASWTKYIKPVGEDGQRRKAPSLRATLQSLVVRHRMDTIHNEIPLPPLSNRVVHLEPTFYDRLSLNLFIFTLVVNAITSERTDQDYMFHPRNRKHLSQTIGNLRQAGFWWAGFDEKFVSSTSDIASGYLEKNRHRMPTEDIAMLTEGIEIARKAINCGSWSVFRKFRELGVFVEEFPRHARSLWALDPSIAQYDPLLLGISQARQAQRFVTSRLMAYDPAEGLAGAGIKARRELADREGDGGARFNSPRPPPKTTPDKAVGKSPKKSSFSKGLLKTLPGDAPLARPKFVATASAKLTYLLDRVLELHKREKIIIFYDNNNTAFWIAEGLETIGVDFRIYANTLKPALRTAYLALFRESDGVRVLLMDLRQASHGLHIANASRVFIVNPIWQPNVESQAIKRAHRIGQRRPVYVETLVLQDTLEDRMLRRRKEMSGSEIQQAEKDLLDDSTMSTIIQNERFIPMPDEGEEPYMRVAFLREPPGFFDRHPLPLPDEFEEEEQRHAALSASGIENNRHVREISPFVPSQLSSPTKKTSPKRKRTGSALRFDASADTDTTSTSPNPDTKPDEDPDPSLLFGISPSKRRKNASTAKVAEYVNEDGIVMTPSRTPLSSRQARNGGSITSSPRMSPNALTPALAPATALASTTSADLPPPNPSAYPPPSPLTQSSFFLLPSEEQHVQISNGALSNTGPPQKAMFLE